MSIYRTRNGDISLNSIKNSLTEILPNKSADTIERTKFEQSQVIRASTDVNSRYHTCTIYLFLYYLRVNLIEFLHLDD